MGKSFTKLSAYRSHNLVQTLAMGTSLALYSPVISYLQNAALIQLVVRAFTFFETYTDV